MSGGWGARVGLGVEWMRGGSGGCLTNGIATVAVAIKDLRLNIKEI